MNFKEKPFNYIFNIVHVPGKLNLEQRTSNHMGSLWSHTASDESTRLLHDQIVEGFPEDSQHLPASRNSNMPHRNKDSQK